MRVFIAVLVLIFSLQSWTKADDFRDFEIEGMSIGDSALDFFSENDLKNNTKLDWYDTSTFTPIADIKLASSKTYEMFQIAVKSNDPHYTMQSIHGVIFYTNNDIDKCYKELDHISNDIKKLFKKVNDSGKVTYKHPADKTGKTTITDVTLVSKRGDEISIQCYNWSEASGYTDQLRITLDTKEYSDFVRIAYD